MTNKEDFAYLVEQLLNDAVNDFKKTEQYRLLQEKRNRMDADCETILCPDERGFVADCFDGLADAVRQEEYHVYRQGLLDGVKLLKWLGVLA